MFQLVGRDNAQGTYANVSISKVGTSQLFTEPKVTELDNMIAVQEDWSTLSVCPLVVRDTHCSLA